MGTGRGAALLLVTIAILWSPHSLAAQATSRWSESLADVGDLPTPHLEIDAPYLTVRITGHDIDSVLVVLNTERPGLAALPQPSLRDGVVRFTAPRNQTPIMVEFRVPRRTSVRVRTSNFGPVIIEGIYGVIEVENSNAGIELAGIRSSVVAATSNGPITAIFDRMPDGGALSFLTSNAPVTLTLPDGAGARLILETDGRIESDPVFTGTLDNERDSPRVGQALRGTIGDGGVLIRVRTDNNDIRIINPQ